MKRIVFLILFLLVIISVYKISEQTILIPKAAIRLRVIPNSNSPKDINIKEQVKEYLEKDVYTLTKDTSNIEDARKIIKDNLSTIDKNINNIFNDNEYPLNYNVNYGYNYFPEKHYKEIKYNSGYYESLVISIGEAKGDNWWCVLYPNLCLTDGKNKQKYKSYLKEKYTKYSKKK